MSLKDEYIAKLKAQLDEWSAEIDELEVKAHLAKADAKDKYQEQLAVLKTKRDEAKSKVNELQGAAEDAWEELKKGGEEAWEAITKAVAEARKKFSE